MWYYDNTSSKWVINISIKDNSNAIGINDSHIFTYNELSAMSLAVAYINFSALTLGQTDQPSQTPIILNNTGNDDFEQINITASHLYGTKDSDYYIGVGNFTINYTDAVAGSGLKLDVTTLVIPWRDGLNLSLQHGHTSALTDYNDKVISTKGNQSLYFWVDVPAAGLITQKYNNTWNISVIDLP